MRDVPTIPLSLHISSAQRQRKGQANNGKFCSLGGLEAGNGERIRNVECEMSVSLEAGRQETRRLKSLEAGSRGSPS